MDMLRCYWMSCRFSKSTSWKESARGWRQHKEKREKKKANPLYSFKDVGNLWGDGEIDGGVGQLERVRVSAAASSLADEELDLVGSRTKGLLFVGLSRDGANSDCVSAWCNIHNQFTTN